jgi:UDP-2-acetamido-2-deoxy-ribo-hexuluronate aminotransferase
MPATSKRLESLGSNRIKTTVVIDGVTSTWAQYTLQVSDRATFQAELKAAGVPTMVYYPIPLSRQPPAYAHYPGVPTPVSEALSGHVASLPMHPYLSEETQDRIIAAVLAPAG